MRSRLLAWPGSQGQDANPDHDDHSSDDGPWSLSAHGAALDHTRSKHEPGESDHHQDQADGASHRTEFPHAPSLPCRTVRGDGADPEPRNTDKTHDADKAHDADYASFLPVAASWGVLMAAPRLVSVLTENWTLSDPRDLGCLVRMAQEAEDSGFDMVMVSDHVLLGPSAGSAGRMANPRDYAMPGNQDPRTAWPSNVVLLSAMAQATSRIRLGAIALIAPLRHPLVLAHDLAALDLLSKGRLVIQPTVSWHRDEYQAIGIDFHKRGRILDEQLEILRLAWAQSPATYRGEFFSFADVYLEPKPWLPHGPAMWFGGEQVHGKIVERLIRYGSGFHPVGRVMAEDIDRLRELLAKAGRATDDFEMVGGTRVDFPDAHSCAPLPQALEEIPRQMSLGFTTFCIKPSIFIDDIDKHRAFCEEVVARVEGLTR